MQSNKTPKAPKATKTPKAPKMKKTKTTKANTISIAKEIELDILTNNASTFIPASTKAFIDHSGMLKTLAIGIKNNLSVLIIGESGTGKTSAIRHLAKETNNGLRRINLNGGTTADELVGRKMFNDKGTYWVDGVLTEAMRQGDWIVLDEINAALPEVLFVLQSIMDDDGFLVLTEKDDKEIVHKHPNFRLFATCNPPEYAGTKEMNKALLSRFSICISADYAPEAIEKSIIEHHLGAAIANTEMTNQMISLANETRTSKEQGKTDYAINTRDILSVLQLAQTLSPTEAFALGFANKLDSTDKNSIKTLAQLRLPKSKKGANVIKTDVAKIDDITIANTYIIENDILGTYTILMDKSEETNFWNKLKTTTLSDIISSAQTEENGMKNDEFTVCGTYYENNVDTYSQVEQDVATAGTKVASIVEITAGPNKNKLGVILHNEFIDSQCNKNTCEIIKNIKLLS